MKVNARMKLAMLEAQKGTCPRRKIGVGLYDKDGFILGIGYNGVDGVCQCPGRDVPAGAGNAECYGKHAEVRAIEQAYRAGYRPEDIASCYSTKAPCTSCTEMLLETGCQKIVFQTMSNETRNREIWEAAGRKWEQQ